MITIFRNLSHCFKLGSNLLSCQVSEKFIHMFGQNDGTNIETDTQTDRHTDISFYIYRIYIHTLEAYTRHCAANINIKCYRSNSNFNLVGPLIRFSRQKQVPVDVAMNNLHLFLHPRG